MARQAKQFQSAISHNYLATTRPSSRTRASMTCRGWTTIVTGIYNEKNGRVRKSRKPKMLRRRRKKRKSVRENWRERKRKLKRGDDESVFKRTYSSFHRELINTFLIHFHLFITNLYYF